MSAPLLTFTSHIAGKNAEVSVFPDRIEWTQPGKARVGLAAATMGASALVPGLRRKGAESEMILMRSVSSVTTRKDGLRNSVVSVIAAGNTIDMRVSHGEAERIKSTILAQL